MAKKTTKNSTPRKKSNNNGIKLNQSLNDRKKSKKAEKAAAKALYLSTLPKDPYKRLLARLEPKHLYHYWFSKQGAITGLKIVGIMVLISFFMIVGMFAYFRKDLPQIKSISGDNLGGSVSYYDSTGTVLLFQDYNGIKRTAVDTNQISPYMKEATIAIEDKNFYKEGAFDTRAIARAGVHDILGGGGSLQGGSTITQQLVKLNENWTDDRTIARKVKELILAVEVEREYNKNQILTAYLNLAPYGGVDYGVQSAAQDYFRKDAKDLTLAQASMLAAIPQSPSYYSPYGSTKYNPAAGDTFNPDALLIRQHYILGEMVKQGYITKDQAKTAESEDVLAQVQTQSSKYTGVKYPYYVLAAKQQLQTQFGTQLVTRGGLKVITSLNTKLQDYAEQDVAANAANVKSNYGDEQALVEEDVKTGQVVALVGGQDFSNPDYGQINYANTNLQPGSTVKPFMYAGLIQNNNNVGAGSIIYDSQSWIPGYPCTDKTQPTKTSDGGNCLWDSDYNYPGAETIRYALAGSRNVPAVKASYMVDPNDTEADGFSNSVNKWIGLANGAFGQPNAYACYNAGIDPANATSKDRAQCYGSAAIGSGLTTLTKLVNGDSTLARLGTEYPQTFITSVTDSAGKSLYKWVLPKGTQAYKPDTAYIINNILSDPKASYLPGPYKFQNYNGWNIAVKTGTQNQSINGLMTAWSTQYAVASLVAYHTLDKPLRAGHFEIMTEPLTKTLIEQSLNNLNIKPVNWTQPADIKTVAAAQSANPGTGAETPSPSTEIFPSWYIGKNSSASAKTIDKVSNLIATTCTPDLAKDSQQVVGANTFSIDIFYPTKLSSEKALQATPVSGTSTDQQDNVHNCNDTQPSVTVSVPNNTCASTCTITVAVTGGTHQLSGGSYTADPAGTLTLSLGNDQLTKVQIPGDQTQFYNYSYTWNPTTSGSNGNLTATVVDSVLYQASNNINISTYGTPAATSPVGSTTGNTTTPVTTTTPTTGTTNTGH